MHAIKYFLIEALVSLRRDRRAAALAVLTIAAGLFLFGVFLLIDANVERLVGRWTASAELSVYLADDIDASARATVEATLTASPLVDRYEFVSKADALARFKRDFPDLADLSDQLDDNPLPPAFEVRLRSTAGAEAGLEDLAARLGRSAGVLDVRYDRQWVSRLMTVVALLRGISLAIITIVAVAAALTVASVVRLATYARRDEIEIMQLVGSPTLYIRGPFVVEGVLQGGLGALVAVGLLWGGYSFATMRYGQMIADALGLDTLTFLPWTATTLVIVGGMLVGCVGGAVASKSAGR
jgi:cell division transport system permease protein